MWIATEMHCCHVGTMRRLCRWRLIFAFLAFVLIGSAIAGTPVHAQSASFRSVDTNSDGVLSRSELVAAFGQQGAQRLLRKSDHNGDGALTIRELRRASGEPVRNPNRRDRDDDDDDDGDDSNDDGNGGDGADGDGGDD